MESARDFAIRAHGDQKYGDKPYVYHLDKVNEVAQRYVDRYTYDVLLKNACYLHDTIEDTHVTYTALVYKFDLFTAEIVAYVTDKPGRTRKERHENTYPELSKRFEAVFVKLCDRIANVEECGTGATPKHTEKRKMYAKEHTYFRKTLKTEGQFASMWDHLDKLLGCEVQ